MKYWFFDGNDVVGPFEPKELLARPGFAATSLVCPENYSEDQDSWKMAGAFEEFHFSAAELPSIPPPAADLAPGSFDEEMNTLLKARSPLGDLGESPSETPSLELPKKPAKPGPIEDYFNNIKGEDLGDILGIPDPNENSDMNLARALQKQFNKTTPPPDKEFQPIENDPFDEFTSDAAAEEDWDRQENTDEPKTEAAKKSAQQESAPEKAAAPSVPMQPAKSAQTETATTTPKEELPPQSVKISQPGEEELVLTIHGKTPLPAPNKPQDSAPKKEEDDEAAAPSTFQLPVLGQPETELPPLPDQPPAFESQPPAAESEPAPITAGKEEPAPQVPPPTSAAASEKMPAQDQPINEVQAAAPTAAEPVQLPSENKTPDLSQPPLSAASTSAPEPTLQPEELVPAAPKNETAENTVQHILEGKLAVEPAPEIQEPIKNVPVEPQISQFRPRLKQTPEIKEFLNQTRSERIEREQSHKKAMAALSVAVALLAVGAVVYINQTILAPQRQYQQTNAAEAETIAANSVAVQEAVPAAPPAEEYEPEELLPDIPVPPPPIQPPLEEKALEIVQNYLLPNNRGTVKDYLERLYQPQKAQGYTDGWSAEPLHKSTYIVKYRLTKTRMEPIVYIFQADTETGKLTGALNNITLDLVGKIQ